MKRTSGTSINGIYRIKNLTRKSEFDLDIYLVSNDIGREFHAIRTVMLGQSKEIILNGDILLIEGTFFKTSMQFDTNGWATYINALDAIEELENENRL